MSRPALLSILIVAVILGMGLWTMLKPAEEQTGILTSSTPTPVITSSLSPTPTAEPMVPSTTLHTVTFDGSSFSPRTLTVKKGDTVQFKNTGSRSIWIASDPHPIHTKYGTFDARRGYAPSETYSFTFDKTGTWGYHDHLASQNTGTITVTD
jgi:plastocyanin